MSTKVEAAQIEVNEAQQTYLSLVRASKPFSRTMAQQMRIDGAWMALSAAKDWLQMAKRDENNARSVRA